MSNKDNNKLVLALQSLLEHFSCLPCKSHCESFNLKGNCEGCGALRDVEHAQALLNEQFNKEKPMEEEYEVVKSFTIMDLYRTRPLVAAMYRPSYNRNFYDIMENVFSQVDKEYWEMQEYIMCMEDVRQAGFVGKDAEEMLKRRGFIKEKIKDIVLEPGMKIVNKSNNIVFRVCASSVSGMLWTVSSNSNQIYPCQETLREQIKESGCDYEVINE